jgi:hypothetical protein
MASTRAVTVDDARAGVPMAIAGMAEGGEG